MEYDSGDAKRIQHFLKVYEFAALIGRMEQLDEKSQLILEAAAVLHDIGIHKAEEKYGSSAGKFQELEGPDEALMLLTELDYAEDVKERVAFLVGHHHTYNRIDGLDYQILVEADFLVNLFEDNCSEEASRSAFEKIFKTASGRKLWEINFPKPYQTKNIVLHNL